MIAREFEGFLTRGAAECGSCMHLFKEDASEDSCVKYGIIANNALNSNDANDANNSISAISTTPSCSTATNAATHASGHQLPSDSKDKGKKRLSGEFVAAPEIDSAPDIKLPEVASDIELPDAAQIEGRKTVVDGKEGLVIGGDSGLVNSASNVKNSILVEEVVVGKPPISGLKRNTAVAKPTSAASSSFASTTAKDPNLSSFKGK